MKRRIFFLLAVLLFSGCVQTQLQGEYLQNTACFENRNCIFIEIADSESEREKGLMFRESLAKNSGMLFVFEKEEKYSFWMKNTLTALDIIWINEDKKIVDVFENAQPCKTEHCPIMTPKENALYVIEANSGFVKENNVKIGQVAKIQVKSI